MQDLSNMRKDGDGVFPFKIEDLEGWTVRRTDGTVAVFKLAETAREGLVVPATKRGGTGMGGGPLVKAEKVASTYSPTSRTTDHLKEWCNHTPSLSNPLAEFDSADRPADVNYIDTVRLYVGDYYGARNAKDNFDFVIDGGDVISLYGSKVSNILDGDDELVKELRQHSVEVPETRVLKIKWADRQAPDVVPQFWVELNKHLYGEVMTCCQGGHGRSGTAFVCLLLVNSPDYDARDAILHIRAMHCPRAIESVVQHEYINDVAKFLGREQNALEVKKIADYKKAFAASEKPTAVRTRKTLGGGK